MEVHKRYKWLPNVHTFPTRSRVKFGLGIVETFSNASVPFLGAQPRFPSQIVFWRTTFPFPRAETRTLKTYA